MLRQRLSMIGHGDWRIFSRSLAMWVCLSVIVPYGFAQSNELTPIQPRPWCKLSEIITHQRTSDQWTVNKVTYEWNGLIARVRGNELFAVEYNEWGYITRKIFRYNNSSRLFLEENEWDCTLGWCRPAHFSWDGLEGEGYDRFTDYRVTYNELGYILDDYRRSSPDFNREQYSYECDVLFCRPIEIIEREWCNQCGGSSTTTTTRYQWVGRYAKISVIKTHDNWDGERPAMKGMGSMLISDTGQTLFKQVTYANGDSRKEEYRYICQD